MHDALRILVVGGGISGLSAAAGLAGRGHHVTVWESDAVAGGKIRTVHDQGYVTESAASMVYNFLPQVDRFLDQMGLTAQKVYRNQDAKCRYIVKQGKPMAVPFTPGAFLSSPFWPASARLRIMAEPFIPRRIRGEEESVANFIRRRFGAEFMEQAMDPFLGGTLATDPETASAAATLPRLTALERRFGSLFVGTLIKRLIPWKKSVSKAIPFSFSGGMGTLIRTLANRSGVRVRTGIQAEGMDPLPGGGWEVHGRMAQYRFSHRWDRVVLAVPAQDAATLTKPLCPEAASLLRTIRYAPISIAHTGYARQHIPHPLDGIGCMTPFREGMNITGSLWISSAFSGRSPQGSALFSNYIGGIRNQKSADLDDGKIMDLALDDLNKLFDLNCDPSWVRVHRHLHGLPVYDLGHLHRVQSIRDGLDRFSGLTLVGNYMDGVSVRDRLMASATLAAQTPLAAHMAHLIAVEQCHPAC